MRFVILLKADKDTEAGVMHSEQLLADMGKVHDELIKYTPELREQEERQRAQIEAQQQQ